MPPMDEKILILIDGNAIMHRAYHGVGKGHFVPTHNGEPAGMIYGFISTVLSLYQYFSPKQLVVTFDTKEKTFRHEVDENYKAQRGSAPDDFYPQVPYIHEFLDAIKVPQVALPGYESDDLIGSISCYAKAQGLFDHIHIVSGDHDFLQLVDETIRLYKPSGKVEAMVSYGREETIERFGVTPEQIIDYKAITGDSSDNFKGVEGVGPKTASKLLQDYHSIEGIYDNLDALAPKLQHKFESQKEYLMHCRYLAEIKTDIPVAVDLEAPLEWDTETALQYLEKLSFPALARRLEKIQYGGGSSKPKVQKEKAPEIEQTSLF